MNRVLISDRLSELAVGIFGNRGIEVDFDPGIEPRSADGADRRL